MSSFQDRNQSVSSSGSSNGNSSYRDMESALLQNYKTPRHSTYSQRRKLSVRSSSLAVVSLVISVLCLLMVVGCGCWIYFTGISARFHAEDTTDAEAEEVCLPCIQISVDPLEPSSSSLLADLDFRRDESDTDLCCAKTAAQYLILYKLILRRQQEVKKLSEAMESANEGGAESSKFNRSAVSAHFLYKPYSEKSEKSNEPQIQHWKSPDESPLSHVHGGLRFYDNMIYVFTPGIYFVYCQILYNREDMATEQSPKIASSYVMRNSIAYPHTSGILLKARHTRVSPANDRHSSYVGGLFVMHAGDQLFVQVSEPSIISNDEMGSFFGLFKAGE